MSYARFVGESLQGHFKNLIRIWEEEGSGMPVPDWLKVPELSDVYVFEHVGGFLDCCGCRLEERFETKSRLEMIEHLLDHRRNGHHVPGKALDMLADEVIELGDHIEE